MSMNVQILHPNGQSARSMMNSYQGAGAGFGGQLANWSPQLKTANAALLPNLDLGNARAEDVIRNNAFASNGVQMHVDNIVGHMFRLSYKPLWKNLGITEADARAFAREVEQAWLETAEDEQGCWLDAERKRTFTMMIREGVRTHTSLGEIMASAEWLDRSGSPLKTAIKMVSPKRVSNPYGKGNANNLAGGVETDRYGAAIAYHVRDVDTNSFGYGSGMGHVWKRVTREAKNGRFKFLHIFEPTEDGQSRGANKFLSVLEQSQMLPKMQSTKLQNAIAQAMYAATIESELDSTSALELIGANDDTKAIEKLMFMMSDYHDNANIKLDGVKIPHLVPGEKLNLQTGGNADNGYADLESSVLRWLAAGLHVPYEPFAKDYRQSTYSSARASMLEGWRYYMGGRKIIASRFASQIFGLWFEEMLHRGRLTLPRKASRGFYEAKAAWLNCSWIGQGRLAIDGLKEVKEAVLRIESGLSSYEKEFALMGEDYQETFAQQVREQEERKAAGLPPPSWMQIQAVAGQDVQEPQV